MITTIKKGTLISKVNRKKEDQILCYSHSLMHILT